MIASRRKSYWSLYDGLCRSGENGHGNDLHAEALELERAVYRHAKCCMHRYPHEVLRALKLLDDGELPRRRSCGDGARPRCGYAELLELPSVELYRELPCRERLRANTERLERGEALLRDVRSPGALDVPDTGIRCASCNSSNIETYFMQTRRADEGTTVYCTCTACGKRWKM